MNQELLSSLEYIEKEKGIPKALLLEALRQALLSACRKTYPNQDDFEIQIDYKTCDIRLLKGGAPIADPDFGRIAAQTAKQVIIQKIREAERESIFGEYTKRQGDIVTGTVHQIEKKAIVVDFGKTEGILPAREQSPQDHYRQGDIIRAYVLEVKKTSRGPEIILSRSHPEFVKKLFENEVPEIHDGIVQVKAVAREAGSRTKIAVSSSDEKIDCVGSCVGVRGQRVKNIVRELDSEKIDIVRYSDNVESYIRNAMAPAELAEVRLYEKERCAEILVLDDQLSLAIGKKGQNVRLASKLIGWRLDVRSKSQLIPLSGLDGVGEKTEELLHGAGIKSLKDFTRVKIEDLLQIPGIGEKTAERIFASAQAALAKQDKPVTAEPKVSDEIKEAPETTEVPEAKEAPETPENENKE